MGEHYKFNKDFDPILLENHTATLFGDGLPDDGLNCRCVGVGSMPEYTHDFGAVTATVWSTDNQTTNLEMNPMELSQLRMQPLDDVKMRLKSGPAVQQWRSMRTTFYLPPNSIYDPPYLQEWLWRASEFYVYADNIPSFDFYSLITLTACRVLFRGWRFRLEKLPGGEKGMVKIWVSDWPSRMP